MELPLEFLNSMERLLPEASYREYLSAMEGRGFSGFRVNTLKVTAAELFNLIEASGRLGMQPEAVPWCREGFYYDAESFRLSKLPAYYAGLYYLQEPSAMAAVSALTINEHDKVLDLCAAPGGKTLQAAAALRGTGLIVSNDISTGRCKALIKNIEMAGITNAVVINEAPERLKKTFAGFFDKIIVDAPCSGEGMFRKDTASIRGWSPGAKERYAAMQTEILAVAAEMLNGQGEILYSTCTFAREENEDTVNKFLNEHSDFEVMPIPIENGFEPSLGGEGFARLFPHKLRGEGHFLARLRKAGGNNASGTGAKKDEVKAGAYAVLESFCGGLLNEQGLRELYSGKKLIGHEDSLFLVSTGLPDLRGLRVKRSGFYLGDLRRGRFEPSQALAMGLKFEHIKNPLCLPRNDGRVLRYLKGESFEAEKEDGWVVVCLENYPLGFGKMQSGRLKNKYSVSWKME